MQCELYSPEKEAVGKIQSVARQHIAQKEFQKELGNVTFNELDNNDENVSTIYGYVDSPLDCHKNGDTVAAAHKEKKPSHCCWIGVCGDGHSVYSSSATRCVASMKLFIDLERTYVF